MSLIDIKINTVRTVNKTVDNLANQVGDNANRVSSVRHAIDYQIRSRAGIDWRLATIVSDLNKVEHDLYRLYQFIDHSLDLYLQADDKVSSRKLEKLKDKSWWEQLLDGFEAVGDFLVGVVKGLGDAVVATLEGIWWVVTNPIETVKGLVYVVTHPVETITGLWDAIVTSWNDDVINGDAESRGKWFGRAFGEIALAVVGTKGIDKAAKLAKGTKLVQEASNGFKVVKEGVKSSISDMGKKIGNMQIPVGIRQEVLSSPDGRTIPHMSIETKSVQDLIHQFSAKDGNSGSSEIPLEGHHFADDFIKDVDFSKLDNAGVNNLLKEVEMSDLSPKEQVLANIEIYNKAIEAGVKTDVQVFASPNFIDDSGKVDWPPHDGFKFDPDTGKIDKDPITPKVGDVIDRYGPSNGRFTSPVIDGNTYTYDQRALPYIENPNAYHQYEVTRNFDELSDAIKNSEDRELVEKIERMAARYNIDLNKLDVYEGEIGRAFSSDGGGVQWQFPLPLNYLERLGFLKEKTD